ncbi:MAG: phage Gp37/Gp68 family protein [Anaeroplasmataceae bacterium]|nr:phage Gp37/Gp68 family protein [Anaeroplasmataceae bacterium]
MRYSWNPWHGCKKISAGCKNCFVNFLDSQRGAKEKGIYKVKTKFNYPLQKDKNKNYKIPSHIQVATCFTSDFFIEEADLWRNEAWKIIKERPDIEFLIPTKRIHRFHQSLPIDWRDGYENVFICVSVENQKMADLRIPLLLDLPIKKKGLFLAPLLEDIDLTPYLKTGKIAYVSVGGESYKYARECNFDWVLHIKEQCDLYQVPFDFHQTGSNFIKDGKKYKIPHNKEYGQAKKAFSKKDLL